MQSFANLTNLHFIHSRTQETRKLKLRKFFLNLISETHVNKVRAGTCLHLDIWDMMRPAAGPVGEPSSTGLFSFKVVLL